MITYPCHLFAVQTKDREGRFDITKFSDACLCRKLIWCCRAAAISYYRAKQGAVPDFRKLGAVEPTLFVVYLNDIKGTMDRSKEYVS